MTNDPSSPNELLSVSICALVEKTKPPILRPYGKNSKDDIKTLAKNSKDKSYHKATIKIKKLKEEIKALANHPDLNNNEKA